MNRFAWPFLIGFLWWGCRHAQEGARSGDSPRVFQPIGEISFNLGTGASFSADQVVGSIANISRAKDGSWRGFLANQPVHVTVTPDGLTGVNLSMTIQHSSAGLVMTGLWQQRQLTRFELRKDRLVVRTSTHSLDLLNKGNGRYETESLLCHGGVQLKGMAADPQPPHPQFVLSLLATFVPRTQNICHSDPSAFR